MESSVKSALVKLGVLALIAVIVVFNSFAQVPTGYVGMETCFGKMQANPLPNGLNTIAPWCTVETLHVQLKTLKEEKDKRRPTPAPRTFSL